MCFQWMYWLNPLFYLVLNRLFNLIIIIPHPAEQIFWLLRLLPNSTKVFFYTFIHTLPTVTKFYPTISSCTACQTYQKSRKIHNFFGHNFCRIFGLKLLITHRINLWPSHGSISSKITFYNPLKMCKNIMIFPRKPQQITAFLTHIHVLISATSFNCNKSILIQHKKWTSTCAFLQAMMTQAIRNFFNFSFKGIQLLLFQIQNTSLYLQLLFIHNSCQFKLHQHLVSTILIFT